MQNRQFCARSCQGKNRMLQYLLRRNQYEKIRMTALFLTLALMLSLCAAAPTVKEANSSEPLYHQKLEQTLQDVEAAICSYAFDITAESATTLYDFAGNTYTLVAGVINKFCEIYGLPQVAAWGVGLYGVTSEIDKGRPSMLVCKPEAPISCGEHTVVAYGYTPDNHYIVHFGWDSIDENGEIKPFDYTQICVTDAAFHFNACYRMEGS